MCSIRQTILTATGLLAFSLAFLVSKSQDCAPLQIQFTTQESRCKATGSVSITVSGGSGSYSYRVVGPVTTTFTSSSTLSGLLPGTYEIVVSDLAQSCTKSVSGVVINGSYTDPKITINGIPTTCKGTATGEIRTSGLSGGRGPFRYTITSAPTSALLGLNNGTGVFTGLPAGNYTLQLEDSCNGLQTRTVSVGSYDWTIEQATAIINGCGTAAVSIKLKDVNGKTTPDNVFSGFTYGWVRGASDTVWHGTADFQLTFGKQRLLPLVAKDACGNVTVKEANLASNINVSQQVLTTQNNCNSFNARIGSFSNLTNPQFCLLNSANETVACNSNGIFENIQAGQYRIQVKEPCFDTTVTVPFSVAKAKPSINEPVTTTKVNCGYFNAKVNGLSGFVSPQFCVYKGTMLEYCNTTGIFEGLRNGAYRVEVKDACYDTVVVRTFELLGDKPAVNDVTIENKQCSTFDVQVSGTANLTNPEYRLFFNNTFIHSNATGRFTNLAYGTYQIRVVNDPVCYDTTISYTFTGTRLMPSVNAKIDVEAGCSTGDLAIVGQQNLFNPQYCLYDAADKLIACNDSGKFARVPFGQYCIKIKNDPACYDTTLVICKDIQPFIPQVGDINITSKTCAGFSTSISGMENLDNPIFKLKHKNGTVLGTNNTGVFTNVPYGEYCMELNNNLVCYDTVVSKCFSVDKPKPSGGSVTISNRTCPGYTATVTGLVNFDNPTFIFRKESGEPVYVNNTGVFNVQGFYNYCIEVRNDASCYDTSILICQTAPYRVEPSTRGPEAYNFTCTSFSVRLMDVGGVTNPVYQLLKGNIVVATSSIPRFESIAHGSYVIRIVDGCYEQPLDYPVASAKTALTISTTATPGCENNKTSIRVDITGGTAPYSITVYDPINNVVGFISTSAVSHSFHDLPMLASGLKYRVDLADQCGTKTESLVAPQAAATTSVINVIQKCPTGTSPDGVSDLEISVQSNSGVVVPVIIRKNNTNVQLSAQSAGNSLYRWTALEPATYIVEYTVSNCSKAYDTVIVTPYKSPELNRSAIYQCSNNSFSVSTNMVGGAAPYRYQIVSSTPSTPSIATGWQDSPVFQISGTVEYSLIRLRGVDACGNAALDDAGVLPMENVVISATGNCLNAPVMLKANTVPNANYIWFRMNGSDSVIIGGDSYYDIPVLTREDTGVYVVRMSVNGGCYASESAFRLTGECTILGVSSVRLSGRKNGKVADLNWVVTGERNVKEYIVERSRSASGGFEAVGLVRANAPNGAKTYKSADQHPASGVNYYRIRVVGLDGKIQYSNTVSLIWFAAGFQLYPNPARSMTNLQITGTQQADLRIQLVSMNGQVLQEKLLTRVQQASVPILRNNLPSGMYLVRVVDQVSGQIHTEKIIFE